MYKNKLYDINTTLTRLKNYCSVQERCQQEVIQKMRVWGTKKALQEHILELLIQEEYINEERYAKSFCRGKFNIKKWGKLKIIHELKRKNISEACINIGLKEIKTSDYKKELERQYQKKKTSTEEKDCLIKNKKIAIFLINKGYESTLVWEKLKDKIE